MSQERTEREELDQSLIRTMRFEQEKGYQIAGEMGAALREIDRLNAVISDLLEDMKKIAAPYPGVSSPPALERRLIAVKALQRNGVEL